MIENVAELGGYGGVVALLAFSLVNTCRTESKNLPITAS